MYFNYDKEILETSQARVLGLFRLNKLGPGELQDGRRGRPGGNQRVVG